MVNSTDVSSKETLQQHMTYSLQHFLFSGSFHLKKKKTPLIFVAINEDLENI